MLTCPRCGFYNSDVATRCDQCDARLSAGNREAPHHIPSRGAPATDAEPVMTVRTCPSCGALASTPYCPECGARITAEPLYGGFWVRVIASWIDGFILSFGSLIVIGVIPILSLLVLFAIPAMYEIIMEAQSGATLGKRVFKLRVVNADTYQPISLGRSLVRHLAHYVSAIVLLLGFVMVVFNHRKRALHDYIAGTVVIREDRL